MCIKLISEMRLCYKTKLLSSGLSVLRLQLRSVIDVWNQFVIYAIFQPK